MRQPTEWRMSPVFNTMPWQLLAFKVRNEKADQLRPVVP